jgi:geranylgeranyl pyrophosphate synthase
VARLKTVPLLQVAVLLPVILTGGRADMVTLLERYCLVRGVAYQIADDLKDVVGTASVVGKTTGRDELLGRPNIVNVAGFQGARARLLRLNGIGDRVLDVLPGGRPRWEFLNALRPKENWMQESPGASLASAAI